MQLEKLYQKVIATPSQNHDEDFTNLYSLSSTLSDLGVVTYSVQHQKPRAGHKSQAGRDVDFVALEPAEKVIYVSAEDELSRFRTDGSAPFTIIVTFNSDINMISVWHAWYLEEKPLKALLKLRAEHKASKSRRRSSFLSTSLNTGTTTPATRRREGTRESFATAGAIHLQPEQNTALVRKPTSSEEEQAMATQMDPDYLPVGSQQAVRESRRVSSMNADVRASQNTVGTSFAGTVGRRTTSYGAQHGRRSLSHRKSRGSTPGSIYGQSINVDDESMDLDTTIEFDVEESVDTILRHIRATHDVCGIDTVFGNAEEGYKHDLVVRKIHSFAVGLRNSTPGSSTPAAANYTVATHSESPFINGMDDPRLRIYVHDKASSSVQYVALKIKYQPLWPELRKGPIVAVPLLSAEQEIDKCDDICKLRDGDVGAILFGGRGIQFSLDEQLPCPTPNDAPYRLHPLLELMHTGQSDTEFGKNRTITPPQPPLQLQHIGPRGTFDEVDGDTHHRRRLRIKPTDPCITDLITLCELMLQKQQARLVRKLWCMAYDRLVRHKDSLINTACDREFVAFVATLFTFVLGLLNSKARAAISMTGVAMGTATAQISSASRFRKDDHQALLLSSPAWSWVPPRRSRLRRSSIEQRKDQLLVVAADLAGELSTSNPQDAKRVESTLRSTAQRLMLALHLYREEHALCTVSSKQQLRAWLAPVIAQLGSWLGMDSWACLPGTYYSTEGASEDRWAYVRQSSTSSAQTSLHEHPVGVLQWFEHALQATTCEPYPSISSIARIGSAAVVSKVSENMVNRLTPRTKILSDLLVSAGELFVRPTKMVEMLAQKRMTVDIIETFPESIAAVFKEAIARCEKEPPTIWRDTLLRLVGRADLAAESRGDTVSPNRPQMNMGLSSRDVQLVCNTLDHASTHAKTKEAGRHSISQLIFSDDRRLVEATSLMHFNIAQVGYCPKQPDWDEQTHFDHQRRIMQYVIMRMIALPAGDAMLHFDSQTPLLTERYHLPGFNSACLIQPMGYTLTADRSGLTEEKVNWAYFHAGASAGLRISRNAKGIDTSWIAFNKPAELTNRHAGLLLALGLGGHLRQLAKWLSFKYLTPKHTMTSVGLLLGLSASYIGTMDGLITRMLSVHITKMLPPGAAEMNVSPATQTAGLMGIGLVYHNTQHRRMSELMLSEIEHMGIEDPDSGPDPLRDESYRLAAGFALGFINLAKGTSLHGLRGMQLAERLLAMAVGPRPIHAVHVFDRATAGAVMAIALVYMKSGDRSVARKIDIPDTEAQFDQVRPDILMLRAMAKNVILWDGIEARGPTYEQGWIQDNLPACYKARSKQILQKLLAKRAVDSTDIPLLNVFTGLAWALSLKYAGSGNIAARDEILSLLTFFHTLIPGSDAYYFDGKMGRASLRRCMDVLALSGATVMAGTGDLDVFRHLRRLHGRTDVETPYGSHLAAHLAIGLLFLGGGTYTLNTSDLAIASLMVAFYPLFPIDVHDNRVHLQAFRHLWVFAAEPRCIVVEDIDTHRPIHMPIKVTLRDGSIKSLRAPCLLPELHTISTVQMDDSKYWQVVLDFAGNPKHLEAFKRDQRISVRRCPASEAHDSVFSAALAAFTNLSLTVQPTHPGNQNLYQEILSLPAFETMDRADTELLLPLDVHSSVYTDDRTTVVDDRLVLSRAVRSNRKDDLWNLRLLFAWSESRNEMANGDRDAGMRWLGQEVVNELRARIEARCREVDRSR
jgi:anaphase-promoting complex subunit 1